MKKFFTTANALILPVVLILGACTKSAPTSLSSEGSANLAADEHLQDELAPYLTADEIRLSSDQSYMKLSISNSATNKGFNWLPAKEVKDINITGQVFVIDSSKSPWTIYNNATDIRYLKIEADTIIVKNRLTIPGTKLDIHAKKMVFLADGSIDVTPLADTLSSREFNQEEGTKRGRGEDGKEGIEGPLVRIYSEEMEVLGDQKSARIIAKGGKGQDAGKGWGQTPEDFKKEPKRENKKEVIVNAGEYIPTELRRFHPNIIYSGPHSNMASGSGYLSCINTSLNPSISSNGGIDARLPMDLCKKFDWKPATGTDQWPLDGRNGIPGGKPGAGGVGGRVYIYTNNNSVQKPFVDVSAGENGAADTDHMGTLGGLPNPAYKITWKVEKKYFYKAVLSEPHYTKDGRPAKSPQKPDGYASSPGQVFLSQPEEALAWSKDAFELKIKRLKEKYVARDFVESTRLLKEIDQKLNVQKEDFEGKALIALQLGKIKRNLINQKDYFGRGLKDAPRFAFDFNLNQYNAEVNQAMTAYYLASVFTKSKDDNKARLKAAKDALDVMQTNIQQLSQQVNNFNGLNGTMMDEVARVEREENDIQKDLEQLKEQIAANAEINVEARKRAVRQKGILDVAIAVCKVVPAWQPALAAGAMLAEQAMKGNDDNSLAGWVNYGQQAATNWNSMTSPQNVEASKASWNNFRSKFDPSNLNNKDFDGKVQYLQNLYKEMLPVATQISEAFKPLNQPVVNGDEVQQEIEKLKHEDPLFVRVASRLENLMAAKKELNKKISEFKSLVEGMTVQVNDYLVTASKTSNDVLSSPGWADDGVLASVFTRMSDEAEERLLFLFDETVQSYNYITLESYSQPISTLHLRQKMDDVMAQTKDPKEAIERLTLFYTSQVNLIKTSLREKLREGNSLLMLREASNTIELTAAEIKTLEEQGSIEVPLEEDFYLGRSNAKISEIVIDTNHSSFERIESETSGRFPAITFQFNLGKKGSVMVDDVTHTFFYDEKYDRLFQWENTFKFQGDAKPVFDANQFSSTLEGIVASISDKEDAKSRTDSRIFALHAGLTNLHITLKNLKAPYKLNKLSVLIKYEYSH